MTPGNEELAYLNGVVFPRAELMINPTDSGFLLGTTVSETLRTFGGKLFHADRHFARLHESLKIIDITSVDLEELSSQAASLVRHNYSLLASGSDLNLSVFVTPGDPRSTGPQDPTVGLSTCPLPFANWADTYRTGQRLITSTVRQVPPNCWPAELKCRSRMHYYLADREARAKDPKARAVLLDQDGFVAEASTASIVIYTRDTGLISPRREKVLAGISVDVICELAQAAGIRFSHQDISLNALMQAEEVFLCSTSPCMLPVCTIDNRRIGAGGPGRIFSTLMSGWNERVGLDVIAQAQEFRG